MEFNLISNTEEKSTRRKHWLKDIRNFENYHLDSEEKNVAYHLKKISNQNYSNKATKEYCPDIVKLGSQLV